MELKPPSPAEIETPLNLSIKLDPIEEIPFELESFGIFEGGGAKGLAHVGALSALEERGVKFKGVAGTSAGAIVAALVGAGYSSEEMFVPDPVKPTGIFTTDFTTLLSRYKWLSRLKWKFLSTLRKIGECCGKSPYLVGFPVMAFILAIVIGFLLLLNYWLLIVLPPHWVLLFVFIVISVILIAANFLFKLFGYFSTSSFQTWLNDQLSKKLYPGQKSKEIKFNDLPVPVTIIAADLNSKKIVTFNKNETPDIMVAKAVAASISIPGAFKPMVHEDMVLVDGGMLSNFPAWALDNEAEIQTDITPTFGFRLNPVTSPETNNFPLSKRKTFYGYAKALIKTAFLGENILEARQVLDLSQIPLTVSVSTLDFDLTNEQKITLYEEGKQCADKFYRLDYIGPKNPSEIDDLFEYLDKAIQAIIQKPNVHLRINLALPIEPNRKKLRILYRRNMEEAYDDRLVLGIEQGAIGRCWQLKDTVLVDMDDAKETFKIKWSMTKYQQRLVRDDLKTLVSIPVFEPKILDKGSSKGEDNVLAVLSIDSDEDLAADFLPLNEKDGKSLLWPLVDLVRKDIATALRS